MYCIRHEIDKRELSIGKAADLCGVNRRTLYDWLEEKRTASLYYLIPVLDALGLKLTVERK